MRFRRESHEQGWLLPVIDDDVSTMDYRLSSVDYELSTIDCKTVKKKGKGVSSLFFFFSFCDEQK